MKPISYINNTSADLTDYHKIIIEAIANNGVFTEEFSDIFQLTKCPEGSNCDWALDFLD